MPSIRDAAGADAERVAEVHVASWRSGYRDLIPDDYLDGLDPADRLPFWRDRIDEPPDRSAVLVAEDDDGVICGLATVIPHGSLGPGWAVLPHLYLHPDAWGKGIGVALLGAALDRARALGYTDIELWVVPGNARARRVYEAGGWTTDGTEQTEAVWGVELPEVRYVRRL